MNPAGWVLAGAGLVGAGIFLWPQGTGGGMLLKASYQRPLRLRALWVLLPALLVGWFATARIGFLTGIAAMLLAGVCGLAGLVMGSSRRAVHRSEGMARLAAVLANQATVSATAVEALSRAAPLVSGPVGQAARQLAEQCAQGNLSVAADAFVRTVPTEPAEWLADIVSITAAGGGQVRDMLAVLESRAGEHATTVRLFHSKVAALLPQLISVVVLGAGVVATIALVSADMARWLASPQGQAITLLSAVLTGLLSTHVLLPAWKATR